MVSYREKRSQVYCEHPRPQILFSHLALQTYAYSHQLYNVFVTSTSFHQFHMSPILFPSHINVLNKVSWQLSPRVV